MPRPALIDFSDGAIDAPAPALVSVPTESNAATSGWHAGGGGSRETLSSTDSSITSPDNPYSGILIEPLNNHELLRKVLFYGAIACVGLVVLKKFK